MKKLLALLLALAMLVACFAGCSKTPSQDVNNPGDNQGNTDNKDNENQSSEPMEITWLPYNQIGITAESDTEVQKLIEEKFNVKFKMEQVDIHNQEQWNLYWATGSSPDIAHMNQGASAAFKLADQGLIRSIPEGWLEEYMPDWMNAIYGFIDKETIDQSISYNGQTYLIPYASYTAPYMMAIRKDWMDNLGITEYPTNPDELFEILKRFTFEDPDGNGKNDTYGMHGGAQTANQRFGYVHTYDNIWPDVFWEIDGKVTYTSTTEAYKNELKYLNSWFEAGVIDPEFATEDRTVQRKKWAEGRFGVICDNPWWFSETTAGNLTQMLTDSNPDAEVVLFPPFTDKDGKQCTWRPKAFGNSDGASFFGANCSDEKMKKIMEIKNYFSKDWDFFARCFYGEEGVDYTVEDGVYIQNAEATKPEYQNEKGLHYQFAMSVHDPDTVRQKMTSKADAAVYNEADKYDVMYYSSNFVFPGVNQAYNQYWADIKTISDEFYYNAIMGKVDIDKEWDSFQANLKATGLDDIIKEYQDYLDSQK